MCDQEMHWETKTYGFRGSFSVSLQGSHTCFSYTNCN